MKNMTLSSKITFSENILFREIQGEAVLLNINTGIYFGLDSVGTATWHLLKTEKRLQTVLRTLIDDYDVEPKQCEKDLLHFVQSLQKNGLIESDGT